MGTIPISRSAFYRYFDDVHELMAELLKTLEGEILEGASPWFSDDGDPVALLYKSLEAEARICYRHGPFIKAVSDATGSNARLEDEWNRFLDRFDEAVVERVVADQELGLIEVFDPLPVATALNRLSASVYIRDFGRRPRSRPGPVLEAISRVWISTLYGQEWVAGRASSLVRQG